MVDLQEFRCQRCHTLLCKEDIESGEIEIKCYRCNYLNRYGVERQGESRLMKLLADILSVSI